MKRLSLAALLLCCHSANAQFEGYVYEEDSSISITEAGIAKTLAWSGGFNNPQIAAADLNKDGLTDLVVYQRDRNSSVKTFINYGTPSHPNYRYRPQYSKNFPHCNNYLILIDYNRDGIPDLFESGGRGFTVYQGYYNSSNELAFNYYKYLTYTNDKSVIGVVSADVNPQDIPAIADIDNDGDLDFLSYYGDGLFIRWYQNLQQELGQPKDTITIRLADYCWGKINQGGARSKTLGVYCDNSSLMRSTESDPGTSKITDGGNTPCLIDMDGDGDYDMLDGHVAFNYLVYLENGKTGPGANDSIVYQDIAWNTFGDTAKIAQWPAAFHVDIDADGIRDLIVSPNANSTSENYRCSQYYKNIGTDKIPSFKFQTDTFLVSDAVDVGSNAYPFFYDYNRDGKPDLFVGSGGYYETVSGQFISSIMYLQNTSTSGHPSFEIITKDFLGLSAKRFKGITIGIGDMDNDGKDDLLMGHIDGTIDIIKNTSTTAIAQPDWSGAPDTLRNQAGVKIKTTGNAVPLVYDMNADGTNDLVIGDKLGYLHYYENRSSSPGSTELLLTNDQLGFVKTDRLKTYGYSAPFIGVIDNSAKPYLMMGSGSGRIFRFTDFQGGAIFGAFTQLDSAYSQILNTNPTQSLYMSAPAIADIDGDGKFEMVVGNIYGGLLLFKQVKTVSINDQPSKQVQLNIFPNPAGDNLSVGLNQTFLEKNTSLSIYNALGQLVKNQSSETGNAYININISSFPDALYFCILQSGNKRYSGTFVKHK